MSFWQDLAVSCVMAVAFTAYAFDSNVENGGNGVKFGLYRVQAARFAFFDAPYRVQAARVAFFDTPYGVGMKTRDVN
jgi:hypothetical protein